MVICRSLRSPCALVGLINHGLYAASRNRAPACPVVPYPASCWNPQGSLRLLEERGVPRAPVEPCLGCFFLLLLSCGVCLRDGSCIMYVCDSSFSLLPCLFSRPKKSHVVVVAKHLACPSISTADLSSRLKPFFVHY